MLLDGPINGLTFQAYVDQVLLSELQPGDIVIMDNLGSHKRPGIRAAIETIGASLLLSPALHPRFQSDRERLRQAQGPVAQSRRALRRGPLERHRPHQRTLLPHRVRQLLPHSRISPKLIRNRSNVPDLGVRKRHVRPRVGIALCQHARCQQSIPTNCWHVGGRR